MIAIIDGENKTFVTSETAFMILFQHLPGDVQQKVILSLIEAAKTVPVPCLQIGRIVRPTDGHKQL